MRDFVIGLDSLMTRSQSRKMSSQRMESSISCGKGFSSKRGVLVLANDRLGLSLGGEEAFDVHARDIEWLVWHWYSFDGAFEAKVHGKKYSVSFVPTGATLGSWFRGMKTGRAWRVELTRILEGEEAAQAVSKALGPRLLVWFTGAMCAAWVVLSLLLLFVAFMDWRVGQGIKAYDKKDYATALGIFQMWDTDKESQFHLGLMYKNGAGVAKDVVEGYKWLTLAYIQSYPGAEKVRDQMRREMTPEQIALAEQRAMQFNPKRQ
jgi:hypothetical protein